MKKILFGLMSLTMATSIMAQTQVLEPVSSNINGSFEVVTASLDTGIKLNIPSTITFTPKHGNVIIPESMTSLDEVNGVLERSFDSHEVKVLYLNGNERPTTSFKMAVSGLRDTPEKIEARFFTLGDTSDIATRCNVVYNRSITEGSPTAAGLTLGLVHTADVNSLQIKVAGDYKYLNGRRSVIPGRYEIAGKVWAKVTAE